MEVSLNVEEDTSCPPPLYRPLRINLRRKKETPQTRSAMMATEDSTPSFARAIQPLFRKGDRESILFAFDLWNYDDVRTYAQDIPARLTEGSMPCDGEWPEEQVGRFRNWIEAGMPA